MEYIFHLLEKAGVPLVFVFLTAVITWLIAALVRLWQFIPEMRERLNKMDVSLRAEIDRVESATHYRLNSLEANAHEPYPGLADKIAQHDSNDRIHEQFIDQILTSVTKIEKDADRRHKEYTVHIDKLEEMQRAQFSEVLERQDAIKDLVTSVISNIKRQ